MNNLKIDKKNIDRLLSHLNNQRALLAKLEGDSRVKHSIEAEVKGIELSLLILGIDAK